MEFKDVASLFEKLESTSKRLEKIMILRDFYIDNSKQTPLLFDVISGSFLRELDKRQIGISIKTLFAVLSAVSGISSIKVEKEFNKKGDIGAVAIELLGGSNQKSLFSNSITLSLVLSTLDKISKIEGKDSQTYKKEELSKLFFATKTDRERKYLARLLLGDLRIGVSEGVLKEAYLLSKIPPIVGISLFCSKCSHLNLNLTSCINCQEKLDVKNQEELFSKEYTLKECLLDLDDDELLKFLQSLNKKEVVICNEPRTMYNRILMLFEITYNLTLSFRLISKDLEKEGLSFLHHPKIRLGHAFRSMLGTRATSIEAAIEISDLPALLDYKYDGLRVQIHNNKGEVKLFTRNLDNITKQFPELVEYIKTNYSKEIFVLDTECIAYDFTKKKHIDFQMLSRRILTKKVDSVSHISVALKVFDVLYLKGETLIMLPYERRREKISDLLVGRTLKQKFWI